MRCRSYGAPPIQGDLVSTNMPLLAELAARTYYLGTSTVFKISVVSNNMPLLAELAARTYYLGTSTVFKISVVSTNMSLLAELTAETVLPRYFNRLQNIRNNRVGRRTFELGFGS